MSQGFVLKFSPYFDSPGILRLEHYKASNEINSKGVTREPVVRESYCYFDSMPTDTTFDSLVDKYRVFLTNEIRGEFAVAVYSRDPLKLVDYLAEDYKSMLSKVCKHLGIEHKYSKKETQETKTHVAVTEGIKLLQDVLRQCPKVTVVKPKLKSVRTYLREIKQKVRALEGQEDFSVTRLLNFESECVRLLKQMSNDNNCTTEEYQYPVTQEQYNALCLMQSFNTPFDTCQRLCLENLSLTKIQRLLWSTNADLWKRLLAKAKPGVCYSYEQMSDFKFGTCDRFFRLDNEGFVNKRFHLYHSNCGEYVALDNFYNTSKRHRITIGNTTIESWDYDSEDDVDFFSNTYKNESLDNKTKGLEL